MDETAIDSFRQETTVEGDLVVWRISGPLNFAHYDELKVELARQIGNESRFIVLDLRNVLSIDSRGLSFLVTAQRAVRGVQGRLVLVNLGAKFAPLFETTLFNRIFEIFLDIESAKRSFGWFRSTSGRQGRTAANSGAAGSSEKAEPTC